MTLPPALTLPPARRDAGLTLVEVLVAMGLTGLLLALLLPVVTSTARATRAVDDAAARTASARTALEIVTRTLRTGVRPAGQPAALISAGPTGVVGYSLLNRTGAAQVTDAVPTLVSYAWTGGCVQETTTTGARVTDPASGAVSLAWTAPPRSRCILRTATAPAFRYYTTAVLASGGTDTAPIALPAGGLTDPAQLARVTAIEISITASSASGSGASTQVLGRVTLSNVISGAVAA